MTPSVRKDVILVVDDSPDSLGMIHHALDQAGLTALVALERAPGRLRPVGAPGSAGEAGP